MVTITMVMVIVLKRGLSPLTPPPPDLLLLLLSTLLSTYYR